MPKCIIMSIVSYNSLIAWEVDIFACAANIVEKLQ